MSIAGLESELIECLSDYLPDVFPLICSIEIVPNADLGIWETQPSNMLPGGLGKPLEQILCSHKRQNPLVSFHPFRMLTAVPLFLLLHLCFAVGTHGSTPIHLTGPAKDYRLRRRLPNAWGLYARSSERAVHFFSIRRRSRLHNSLHHALAPGLTSLAPAFLLLEVLPQRLLDLRQPVLADGVSLHRLLDLRDKLVNVWLLLRGEPVGGLLEDLVVLVEAGAIKRNLVAHCSSPSERSVFLTATLPSRNGVLGVRVLGPGRPGWLP